MCWPSVLLQTSSILLSLCYPLACVFFIMLVAAMLSNATSGAIIFNCSRCRLVAWIPLLLISVCVNKKQQWQNLRSEFCGYEGGRIQFSVVCLCTVMITCCAVSRLATGAYVFRTFWFNVTFYRFTQKLKLNKPLDWREVIFPVFCNLYKVSHNAEIWRAPPQAGQFVLPRTAPFPLRVLDYVRGKELFRE